MTTEREKTLSDVALIEIAHVLSPLRRLDSGDRIVGLARDLGWQLPGTDLFESGFTELVTVAEELIQLVRDLAAAETDDDYVEILEDLPSVTADVVELITKADGLRAEIQSAVSAYPAFLNDSGISTKAFPTRLLDYLVTVYLRSQRPGVFAVLNLLGIVEERQVESTTAYEPPGSYVLRVINWDRIGTLVTDPAGLADATYGWNSDFDSNLFLTRLHAVLRNAFFPAGLYQQDPAARGAIDSGAAGQTELRIPIVQGGDWPGTYLEAGINVAPLAASVPKKKGFAVIPYLVGSAQFAQGLGDNWELGIRGSLALDSGLGLLIRPPHDLQLDLNLFEEEPQSNVDGRLEITVTSRNTADQLYLIFGSKNGSRLGFEKIGFAFIVAAERGEEELAGEIRVEGLTLVIDTSEGDGFLQKLLSGITVESVVDLAAGVSNKEGFYFRGSGALEITIPIHESLGPIQFEAVHITIAIADGLEVGLAVSFGAELGPISASVSRIGLTIPAAIKPDGNGNIGPVDVRRPRFKPPTGAGLSLDAGGIVGDGFLDIDNVNKRYAGVLGLNFGEIGLTAIGLIATRMPDGSDGFSLLINIGVTFDPPIQLSMGFTLAGVGGLIGINRSMDIIVLQTGIRNRTLDSILFPDPRTVVANASRIISDLQSVFPVTEGRFVVGPMVKINYGTPAIITADIGIFLDLPDPIRVVLMGQVEATFPEPNNAVVQLHLDILGVLDFQKQELTFQASLYDSVILVYQVYGDSAFILGWGSNRRFALSLGGFHPKFTPPPPPIIFADLKRLTICISKSSNFQLAAQAYQALTPNSLQFGCRVDLYAAVSGATVTGFLGFEALIYFSPFSFEVWIGAGVCVRYHGKSIADVHLSLTLSGPGAWRARGNAKISIKCLPDLSVDFDFEWGDSHAATLPAVNAWPRVQAALTKPGNWSGAVPSRSSVVERLRDRSGEPENQIVVHPVGQLEVRQTVVPFGMTLDKINNAPAATYNRFDIARLASNGTTLAIERVEEYFARGQFENLSDHQRLSVPAFERMPAGVRGVSDAVRFDGGIEPTPLSYDCLLLNDDRTGTAPESGGRVDGEAAQRMIRATGARRAAVRAGTRARFGQVSSSARVAAGDDRYCVADAGTLTRATLVPGAGPNRELTRTAADQALAAHAAGNPAVAGELTVVPEYELQEA